MEIKVLNLQQFLADSNTTLVKVKLPHLASSKSNVYDSNTTLVKVKSQSLLNAQCFYPYSNTTLVKVKC